MQLLKKIDDVVDAVLVGIKRIKMLKKHTQIILQILQNF